MGLVSWVWASLPTLFSESKPNTPTTADIAAPAKAGPSKPPSSATPKKAAATASAATPGTGRARREAKRQQEAEADVNSSNYSIALHQEAGKVFAAWSHRSCRPGDVDAWVGLHEVLDHKSSSADEDEIRYTVGKLELSGRRRYKSIRSNKLDGVTTFPLSEDGTFVLGLHNAAGTVGDENLFLAVSNTFSVRKGVVSGVVAAQGSNKRSKV